MSTKENAYKVFVVENSHTWREEIEKALSPPHILTFRPDGRKIVSHLKRENYDVILLELQPDLPNGFRCLKRIKAESPQTPVISISESRDPGLIVQAVKLGAFDFIIKPFSDEKIRLAIERALENRHLKNEIDYLRHEQNIVYDFDRIISNSDSMKRVMTRLKKFAATDSTILITGETGTGKSFLSGAVHFNSARRLFPFIKINCANLPDSLLESELFGHERGSFTGAEKTRIGRLEQGRGGTVFLDEIGEMSPPLQAKLLRVLEDKSFERVGGNQTIYSDVRIIAATNKKLEDLVTEGLFREDLFYRLNVLRLHLPPLRERKDCIEELSNFFLTKTCVNLKKTVMGYASPTVIDEFKEYSWPGNIRQLANTIERAVILEDEKQIRTENIIMPEPAKHALQISDPDRINTLYESEKEMILRALAESLWVQKDAATLLGVSPRALNYKIKNYGITHARWRKHR